MKTNDILTWRIYFPKLFYLFVIFCLSSVCTLYGQTILNGSFEISNAPTGISQTELSNVVFDNFLPYCYSYGIASDHRIDLMTNDQFNNTPLPQEGNWYIGIQSDNQISKTEQFSMELSDSMEVGDIYQLSFYAIGFIKTSPAIIEIGISLYNNDFGILVYSSPVPSDKEWQLMLTTFIPSIKAKYITVRASQYDYGNYGWSGVDNFCLSQDGYCVDLPEFKMPNVFTPNNDGINDTFKPIVFKGMKSGHLVVLNRWGQVVYETNDLQIGWNGQINGNPASDGVYFWKVEYTTIFDEDVLEHGYLTLLR